uniref:Uncharacterized protein n=1 Tax=Arundo donax TaxID=35708 RepID=A0A0A9FI00_ARUDO
MSIGPFVLAHVPKVCSKAARKKGLLRLSSGFK